MTRPIRRRSLASISRSSTTQLETYLQNLHARRQARLLEMKAADEKYYSRFQTDSFDKVVHDLDSDLGISQIDRDLLINFVLAAKVLRKRRAKAAEPQQITIVSPVKGSFEFFEVLTPELRKSYAIQFDSEYDTLRSERLGSTYSEYYANQRKLLRDGRITEMSDALKSAVKHYVSGNGAEKTDSELENLKFHDFTLKESQNTVNRIFLLRVMRRNREDWERYL